MTVSTSRFETRGGAETKRISDDASPRSYTRDPTVVRGGGNRGGSQGARARLAERSDAEEIETPLSPHPSPVPEAAS